MLVVGIEPTMPSQWYVLMKNEWEVIVYSIIHLHIAQINIHLCSSSPVTEFSGCYLVIIFFKQVTTAELVRLYSP